MKYQLRVHKQDQLGGKIITVAVIYATKCPTTLEMFLTNGHANQKENHVDLRLQTVTEYSLKCHFYLVYSGL